MDARDDAPLFISLFSDARQLIDRKDHAGFIVGVHDGNQKSIG